MLPYAGSPTAWPPFVDILSGSDLPSTTNFNTTSEGTLDRTAYLYDRLIPLLAGGNGLQIANWMTNVYGDPIGNNITTTSFADVVAPIAILNGAKVNDVAAVFIQSSLQLQYGSGGASECQLKFQDSQNGGGYADLPSTPQSGAIIAQASVSEVLPITLLGLRTIATAGTWVAKLQGKFVGGSGNAANLLHTLTVFAVIFRPVPVP